jgi:hypothetical protein
MFTKFWQVIFMFQALQFQCSYGYAQNANILIMDILLQSVFIGISRAISAPGNNIHIIFKIIRKY